MEKTLSGIFPALVTPFQKGKLSLSGLKSNIKKLNRFDFTGYVVLGSTGEGILMNEQEGLQGNRDSARGCLARQNCNRGDWF